jgi:murein DD-endopeptidase MepM/ murein hydrolase activator NlpD
VRPGAVVCLTLCLAVAMGVVGPGAEARQDSDAPRTERTEGAVVGASVVHDARWLVEREPYTYGGTYGFTLWRPESGAPHDHGGTPALRVALAYDLEPGEIEGEVRDRISAFEPDLSLKPETVRVAEEGHEGTVVWPIPGSTPSAEVYVPVNGRVYRINVYAEEPGEEGLDAEDRRLLSTLRFEPPARPVEALGLPRANAQETLYAPGDSGLAKQRRAPLEETASGFGALSGDQRIKEGCWRADPASYFRVQYDSGANDKPGDHIRTGFTIVGKPNYWDEYTHGDLGYGRCDENVWTNDKFAVDYPLNRGDAVFSPFEKGTVTFAGRNDSHRDYGILVSIEAGNGKYVNLSAHLDSLAAGIRKGAQVTDQAVIGYAGDTGGPDIPVGRPHLHQAFYRYPTFMHDGSPYGGAGLQVVRHHHFRGDGGVHRFSWDGAGRTKAKGDLIGY